MNQENQLRQLIRESIQEYIREIDEAGNRAALEAKISKTQEAIDLRKKKLNMEGLDEAYHDMMDKGKMKEMTSEIKMLEKSLAKYGKMLEKMDAKNAPKMEEMEDKDVEEEIIDEVSIDEVSIDENDPESGPQLEEETEQVYEMLLMQKRAGIISETEYASKLEELEEAKKKPSTGLTKKQKSAVSKKAHAGKDIGKKGKGFEKVAKAGEEQYGSKEAGERVAAAAMWKNAAKKAKSLKEEVQALFEDDLNEENEKSIQSFGPKLIDGLKKNGFETNFITNDNPKAQELAKTSPKKLALVYFDKNTNFIQITTNKDNQDEALKVVDSPFVKESLPDNFTYKKQSSYFIEIQPK
jgi:hypothetical protein